MPLLLGLGRIAPTLRCHSHSRAFLPSFAVSITSPRPLSTTPTATMSTSTSIPAADATHKDGSTTWSSKDGQFRRQVSSFRSSISSSPGSQHPPAVGRYRLFVALACPWAHRALIARKLKGIDKVEGLLPVHVVDSLLGPEGWSFEPYGQSGSEFAELKGLGVPGTGLVPGHEDKKRIRDFYLASDPDYSARSTVPVIWDDELGTIVNNESSEIIRMLNHCFDEFVPEEFRAVDLYPAEPAVRKEIDELNEWVYDTVNNGVYKSGFATTQEAYLSNVRPLFASLDRLEALLASKSGAKSGAKAGGQTHLVGSTLTEADIRLFTTLIRFDPVYVGHFKCNLATIRSGRFPHLHNWMKGLYWGEETKGAFGETTDFESIKAHYYQSHPGLNPTRIVPEGPVPNIEPL